jgi:hypothetical protein
MNRQKKDTGTDRQTYRQTFRLQHTAQHTDSPTRRVTGFSQVLEYITTRGKSWQGKKIKKCGRREKAGELPALQTLSNENDARSTNLPNCSSASSALSDLYLCMG